jgi:hypothetical protein
VCGVKKEKEKKFVWALTKHNFFWVFE